MARMYRVDLLERSLARLCNSLEGVRAAVVVSMEGLVVASHPPGDESLLEDGPAHISQMAAMASTLVGLGERTLARLGLGEEGEMGRMVIEGDRGSMIVVPVSDDASMAVLLEKEAKIGVAIYAVKDAAHRIRGILERKA